MKRNELTLGTFFTTEFKFYNNDCRCISISDGRTDVGDDHYLGTLFHINAANEFVVGDSVGHYEKDGDIIRPSTYEERKMLCEEIKKHGFCLTDEILKAGQELEEEKENELKKHKLENFVETLSDSELIELIKIASNKLYNNHCK